VRGLRETQKRLRGAKPDPENKLQALEVEGRNLYDNFGDLVDENERIFYEIDDLIEIFRIISVSSL